MVGLRTLNPMHGGEGRQIEFLPGLPHHRLYCGVRFGGSDGARWTQIRYVTDVYGLRRTRPGLGSQESHTYVEAGGRDPGLPRPHKANTPAQPNYTHGRSGGFCSGCSKPSHALDVPVLSSTYVFYHYGSRPTQMCSREGARRTKKGAGG